MTDTQREAFEEMILLLHGGDNFYTEKYTSPQFNGQYVQGAVQQAWIKWQAALAQAQAEKAELVRQCAETCEKIKVEAGRDFELQAWNSALNTAINEILSLLPKDECQVNPVSSRVCELGTKSCTVYHQRSE